MTITPDYCLRESLHARHLSRWKETLFRWLTRDSMPLFLRGRDAISIAPQVLGYHEVRIKELLENYAMHGYGDFLIDIGANIGLIACQSGNLFKEVHCYEPNPDCFSILRVNARISLKHCATHLYPIGLGLRTEDTTLYVPKGNWGGAFIHDEANSYGDEELGSKDGYKSFDPANYDTVRIRIEAAEENLSRLFRSMADRGLRRGAIKIDVEGYEPFLLECLARTLPDDFEVIIVFECFARSFDPADVLVEFRGRATAFRLARTPAKRMNKLTRIRIILAQWGYRFRLEPFDAAGTETDIVFLVRNGMDPAQGTP